MTLKQIQHLLAYLGYYTIPVDGITGPGTQEAVKRFQRDFGLTADGIPGQATEKALRHAVAYGMPERDEPQEPETGGDFWASVPNFQKSEFACKCGCGFDDIDHTLVQVIQRVREHFGSPVTVSSGCRCLAHNARVGGVKNSRHTIGHAVDFSVRGKSAKTVLAYVQQQPEIKYCYAIDNGYVHMDIGG